MTYSLPHTIQNPTGEKLVFQKVESTPDGDRLVGESFCQPGSGPLMHTHFKQDEGLTVLAGKMGYQVKGEAAKYALPGESVVFKRGLPHRFWAEGNEVLHCKAWIQPANTLVFFLSSVYAAQTKTGTAKPEAFDAAYLLTRYAAEYDLVGIPWFVKKFILPATYQVGKLLGKYKHFKNAPAPLR
jgi:quercetin dioxygenase-like cupin family protein